MLDSVRGLIFGLAGRADEARACFERALAFSRRCQLVWNTYSTSVYYAAFLLRHGETRRARELVEEARRVGAGLGLTGLERELAQLMSRLEGGLPDGLTAREVEVLTLAAQGLATKQIAGELSISYFTAVNHLRHIRKDGRPLPRRSPGLRPAPSPVILVAAVFVYVGGSRQGHAAQVKSAPAGVRVSRSRGAS